MGGEGVNRTDDLRAKQTWRFGGDKSYRRFEGKLDLVILGWGGGVNCTDDLRVNRTWQFWGGLNRTDDLRANQTW